jgi:hypothetical protein
VLFAFLATPIHGSLTISQNGTTTYTPDSGFLGTVNFEYTISDGHPGGTNHATVTIRVVSPNEPPVCAARLACGLTLPNDANAYLISLSGSNGCTVLDASQSSDPDGDALSFQWFLDGSATAFGAGAVVTNCFDLGCHTIALVVTDSKGGSCNTNLSVCVISACEAVDHTIDLVDNGVLTRKNKRPLIASLKSACAAFDRGDFIPALNELEAFQRKVAAQIARGNPNEAAAFTESTQQILDAIKCGAVLGDSGVGNH